MRAAALMAALLLGLAACAKSARDLSPFPCAHDLTCPAGLACVAGECANAVLDSICTVGSDPTDCSAAGTGVICSAGSGSGTQTGACDAPCGSGCPTGRACSTASGQGVCLVDCNGSSLVCPPDTVCLSRDDGHKVCMPPAIGCRALENVKRCTSQLCSSRGDEVVCPDNVSTCPADSTCSSDSRLCTCSDDRQAYDCNDVACNNACGGTRSWWCAPNISGASCDTALDDIQATCDCWRTTIAINCDQAGVTCDELCRRL